MNDLKESVYANVALCIWFAAIIAIAACLTGCSSHSHHSGSSCPAYSDCSDFNFEEPVTVSK